MFNKPPLSPELVETLFARLIVTWGRDFMGQYEGVDDAAIQADWADKLRWYQLDLDSGEAIAPAIAWALDNLPEKPLNVVAFRKLCSQYIAPEAKRALPAPPRPVPARFRKALQALATPSADMRPERVRNAERYVAMWGGDHQKLTPMQRTTLAEMRRILELHAEQQALDKAREPEASHAG